jgi:hypothetical protein
MLVMRPVRAIAVTTTLMDIFCAGSCILFFRRTANDDPAKKAVIVEPVPL